MGLHVERLHAADEEGIGHAREQQADAQQDPAQRIATAADTAEQATQRSTTSPMPPPPCGVRGFQLLFRLPLLPDPPLPLPGVFQAMPTPF